MLWVYVWAYRYNVRRNLRIIRRRGVGYWWAVTTPRRYRPRHYRPRNAPQGRTEPPTWTRIAHHASAP
jgi:hypothetical protein